MASHHHHHGHCHNNPTPSSAACSCCCAAGTGGYPCCPPPPPSTDHLLHSELLLRHHKTHRSHQIHQEEQHQQTQFIISSLLQRIHALESSLRRFSSPPPPSPPSHYDRASRSLRDMAARIIQTHFRSHLVRRSRTLRQLQDLASIKSSFVYLKSSLPSDTHFDSQAFSQKTTHLLLKLDSIQAGDPMIRVRKRAIGRELVRFLEFIDGVAVKRNSLSSSKVMNMKNVRFAQNSKARALREQREMVEKLRSRVEKINGFAKVSRNCEEDDVELQGFHHASDDDEEVDDDEEEEEVEEEPRVVVKVKNGASEKTGSGILVKKYGGVKPKVKKNVSFAESACSDEEEENDVYRDLVENLQADIGRIESRIESLSNGAGDNEGSVQSSDEEKNHRSFNDGDDGRNGNGNKGRGGSSLFSAPLPVKMDDRDDSPSRKFVRV